MKLIVQVPTDPVPPRRDSGTPEFEYGVIAAAFAPLLAAFGTVILAGGTDDVAVICNAAVASGEDCVCLSFGPPHLAPIDLACPVVPVFGWGFSTIPDGDWDDDQRADWRAMLRQCGRAITLSGFAAGVVRGALGQDFPVFAAPVPCIGAYESLRAPGFGARHLQTRARILDSAADPLLRTPPDGPPKPKAKPKPAAPEPVIVAPPPPEPEPEPAPEPALEPPLPAPVAAAPPRRGLRARLVLTAYYALSWYRDVVRDLMPGPACRAISLIGRTLYRLWRLAKPLAPVPLEPALPPPEPAPEPEPVLAAPVPEIIVSPAPEPPPLVTVDLSGVVYVAEHSQFNGRSNSNDLISAFIWAFRDNADATLVLKLTDPADDDAEDEIGAWLRKLSPYQCRVVALFGEPAAMPDAALIGVGNFYVNAAGSEGACLPLMAAMAAGRPAIAPDHTAMADFIDARNAFLLRGSLEHNVWPHDPRRLFKTMRYRMDWTSIVAAFTASFSAARDKPTVYWQMARTAQSRMRQVCGDAATIEALRAALLPDVAAPCREAAE
jgi:hypothetical protein